MCGITWDKVDLENSTVRIEHSLNRYRKSEYGFTNALGTTKSKDSNRIIVFNNLVAEAFTKQRKYQLANGVAVKAISIVDDYGRVIGEANNLAFTQLNGSAWNEPGIIKLIHRIVKKQNDLAEVNNTSKLEYFTPHQIRHTYTTMAFEAGVDSKHVANQLGHASDTTTRDTYTHLHGKKKKEQEDIVNKIRIG